MTDVKPIRTRMLLLAAVSGIILIAFTIVAAIHCKTLVDSERVVYMMAVPIFMTILAFILGYMDINETQEEEEIDYMVRRTYTFGGILFVISLLVVIAINLR